MCCAIQEIVSAKIQNNMAKRLLSGMRRQPIFFKKIFLKIFVVTLDITIRVGYNAVVIKKVTTL